MMRFICAFVTVLSTDAAGIGYMLVFHDEMDPQQPVNIGAGPLAPMYRHWLEFVLIQWTMLPAVAIGFYLLTKNKDITVNWPACRRGFFRLHLASGSIIVAGLSISLISGQPIHLRDSITAVAALGLLAISVLELPWPLKSL